MRDLITRLDFQLVEIEQGVNRSIDLATWIAIAAFQNPGQFTQDDMINVRGGLRGRMLLKPTLDLGGLARIVVGQQPDEQVGRLR